ncbi:prepilin peptidase [Nakamurella silvestris]|nr:prepilin peptidase [Nakamurella silvestris]
MGANQWVWATVAAVAGVAVGVGARRLLSRLRRGTVVAPGRLEPVTAMLFACSALVVGPEPALVIAWWVATLTVVLSAVDLAHHRLPDAITLPAIPLTLLFLSVVQFSRPGSGDLVRAAGAGTAVALLFLLVSGGGRWMGLGDVKLSATVGLILGFHSLSAVVTGIALAFVLGAGAGLVGMVARRLTARSAIPFGPCLLLACWIMAVFPALS